MDGFDRLRESIHGIRIVHHLPGRIRLKLEADLAGLPLPTATDLNHFQNLLAKVAGVRDLRINFMARSCTVEYDPKIIPFDAWGDFLAGKPSAAAQVLEGILRSKYQEIAVGKP